MNGTEELLLVSSAMVRIEIDLNRLEEWTLDSLSVVENANCDALLLGGFSGSVIELFGKFLGIHSIDNYSACYGDFLEEYLPKYYKHKNILYGILRCEGAHAILAQSGVNLTCAENDKNSHLRGVFDVLGGNCRLVIYSPYFVKDLKNAVRKFFLDMQAKPELKKSCEEVFAKIYIKGQNIIEEEIKKGRLSISEIVKIERD